MVRVLINAPKTVRKDQPFEVKLLISHPMESGQRRDAVGLPIPRDIITSLRVTFGQEEVLTAELFPAISANPFLSFQMAISASGMMDIAFSGDHGLTQVEHVPIQVE